MTTVALATCAALPALNDDDKLLIPALKRHGIDALPLQWNSPSAPWHDMDATIVRSTWDYCQRLTDFERWLASFSGGSRLFNPPDVLRWNLNKHYLRELQALAVDVVPSRFFGADEAIDVAAVLQSEGWPLAVAKPVISAGGRNTQRLNADLGARWQRPSHGAMLLQPFIEDIESHGEHSYVFFDGRFSHAVCKRPKKGDFRVQQEHGGTVEPYLPTPGQRRFAEAALAAANKPTLYARVDVVNYQGMYCVMELELIEPQLFLHMHEPAAAQFAAAVAAWLEN